MKNLIYLDNGATSFPKPESVYKSMDRFYRTCGVNPGRSGYDLSIMAENAVDETRKALTQFFNGTDHQRLVFTMNATDALNIAISGILSPGDHVITTNLEHNSVLRPLYHQKKYNNVQMETIAFDNDGFVAAQTIEKAIQPKTRLVIVNHASNVIGTVQPIKEIGRMCRRHGILFLVDASQSAGRIPVDVQGMQIDLLAFTGHKSLMGPTGTGGLYVAEGVEIRHTRAGGTGVNSRQPLHLDKYPYRLEYGTLNTIGIAGLKAGLEWVQEKGIKEIHAHEISLIQELKHHLDQIDNVTTYCAKNLEHHTGVLSFNIDQVEAFNCGTMLDGDYNIACRTGLHCAPLLHQQLKTDILNGTVRISVSPLNTLSDINAVIKAIKEIAKIFAKP